MKKYPLPELIERWEREDLSTRQVIGQILLWLLDLAERVTRLEIAQQRRRPSRR